MIKEFLNANAKEVVEMKINGRSFFGRNITMTKSGINIDGVLVGETSPNIKVEILGSCDSITTASGDIVVKEAAKKINTMSGDIECGAVYGNVETMSGDVKCGDITGSVKTMSGDINCKSKG